MTTLYTAESARDLGFQLAQGMMAAVGVPLVILVIFAGLVGTFYNPSPIGRDDSDPPRGPRSSLNVRTDALTGCQYLQSSQGGLTPRLDAQGRHICIRSER